MSHDFNNGLSNPATLAPEAMDKTGVAAGEKLAADMVVFNSVAQELRAKHCQSAKFEDRCHWVQQEIGRAHV